MRRTLLAALIAAALAGCTTTEYARMIVQQDTNYGRINQAMVGSSEQLVKSRAISGFGRYTMPDSTPIDVWFLKAPARPRGTVLVIHGLCDSKVSYLGVARRLNEKGYDVVLPDLRAHGRSGGQYVTYGALEKRDLLHVMDALLKDKAVAEPVYAFGVSVGGSVAIEYAAIDPRVKGVLAYAPAKDMPSLARRFLARNAILLDDQEMVKVVARAGQMAHFQPQEASAVEAAKALRCPLMLSHGAMDIVIPASDSEAIYAAAGGPKEIEIIPLLEHFGIVVGREGAIVAGIEKLAAGKVGSAGPATGPAGK